MHFNNFELEDLYNKYEERVNFSISSACLDPLSINNLYDLVYKFNLQNKTPDLVSKEEFLTDLADFKIDYSSKFGLDVFQSALKNKYGNHLNFLSTCGASEAIVLIFTSLFKAGDKIIVQKPIYSSLYQIAEDIGVEIIDWNYDWSQDFDFNYAALQNLFHENSDIKSLVINNPNNPTGVFFNNEELNLLIELLRENGSYLVADEVFKDLVNPGLDLKSVANLYEKGISIADLSKSYGLQGLRAGWIAVQDFALREKFLKQKNYFSLRTPILSEYLAAFVLKNAEAILSESRSKIDLAKNTIFRDSQIVDSKYLKEIVLAKLISFHANDLDFGVSLENVFNKFELCLGIKKDSLGGLSCFVELLSNKYSVEELFNFLIEYKILLVPGKVYGDDYRDYFRFSLMILI